MTRTAQFAYGNARVRARKSRLVPPAVLTALASADRPELVVVGWRDPGPDGDASGVLALAFARLMGDYDAVIRAYPFGAALLRAFAQLHELENVKLAWRATASAARLERWQGAWRPMGPLETVSRTACVVSSLPALVAALAATPFAAVAGDVWRAHADDLAAAELALDRWGSTRVTAAADALPRREQAARDLAADVVAERDVAVLQRAIATLGVAPPTALRMTSVLRRELGAAAVAGWTAEGGPPLTLRHRLGGTPRGARTFDELARQIRARRRAACRRVFLGAPYSIAPAIALVLLREDEMRDLVSLAEIRSRRPAPAGAPRVLAYDG